MLTRRLRFCLGYRKTVQLEDDYQILSLLGKGSSSRVYQGMNVLTGKRVVMKMFKDLPSDEVENEIHINRKLICSLPNDQNNIRLIKLLQVICCQASGTYCLIFEYWPGVTLNLLVPHISNADSLIYMRQVLHTMRYIHSLGIVHRDIKPANILISANEARIFDFGLAKEQVGKTQNFGTKCYKSPQVIYRFPSYDQKVDVWALGLVFAEMLLNVRHLLAYRNDLDSIKDMASLCDLQPHQFALIEEKLHKYITPNRGQSWTVRAQKKGIDLRLIKLVRRMLKIDPRQRPTIEQIIQNDPLWNI